MEKLFSPVQVGEWELKNRIAMAPMTRSRALHQGIPGDLAPLYYSQRAGAGLIVTEGTASSESGLGYARTPGMYSEAQVAGWKKVTDAVHQAGSKIVLQLMHVGRIAHAANRPLTDAPVAPSAIRADGQMWTDAMGMQPHDLPRALQTAEIGHVVQEYATATRNAMRAGFEGVELHAASGYLPMQFLSTNTNQRTDQYGGSLENRLRFTLEALQAMLREAGDRKVGIKISPAMPFNDIHDANPTETYTELVKRLNDLPLAYLHLMRVPGFEIAGVVRQLYRGTLLLGGGFDFAQAVEAVNGGAADMVVFGSKYVANPDLVRRLETGAELAQPDPSTFYTPDAKGYTDYPALA